MATNDAAAPRWTAGLTLQLIGIIVGLVVVLGTGLVSVGIWYGKAQQDVTEPIKRDLTQAATQLAALWTQLNAINAGLPELQARVRQQATDLGKLEEALRQVERRGDERDATQERSANEQQRDVSTIRERLAVIERASSTPLPGQVRR